MNLFGDNAFIGIAAVGATFVIISGGIDLSVGSVIAFTGILIAQMLGHGWPPGLALLTSLGVIAWIRRKINPHEAAPKDSKT